MESKPKVLSTEEYNKKYGLSQITQSNSFFSKFKFNGELNELIHRKLLVSERNLEALANAKNFFILYELIPSEVTSLTVNDIIQLRIIKWIMSSTGCHLIIQIADEETYTYTKMNFYQIKKISEEKLKSILSVLLGEKATSARDEKIHIFYNRDFRVSNRKYESLVSQYKMKVTYDKVTSLFNITEEDNVSKLDYPCYIGCAVNGDIYSEYIPSITKDSSCLIINQINKANRYMLCFDASEKMQFNAPSLLAYKIVPQLTGSLQEDCFSDTEHTLLSADDSKLLRKKIMKHSLSGSRGNGSLEDHKKLGGDVEADISCQYLKYIEFDDNKLKENIEKFGKGELSCGEIKEVLYQVLNTIFMEVKKNIVQETDKYYIKI